MQAGASPLPEGRRLAPTRRWQAVKGGRSPCAAPRTGAEPLLRSGGSQALDGHPVADPWTTERVVPPSERSERASPPEVQTVRGSGRKARRASARPTTERAAIPPMSPHTATNRDVTRYPLRTCWWRRVTGSDHGWRCERVVLPPSRTMLLPATRLAWERGGEGGMCLPWGGQNRRPGPLCVSPTARMGPSVLFCSPSWGIDGFLGRETGSGRRGRDGVARPRAFYPAPLVALQPWWLRGCGLVSSLSGGTRLPGPPGRSDSAHIVVRLSRGTKASRLLFPSPALATRCELREHLGSVGAGVAAGTRRGSPSDGRKPAASRAEVPLEPSPWC